MKKLLIAVFVVLFGVSFTTSSFAQDKSSKGDTKQETKANDNQSSEVKVLQNVKAPNTVCPVSKEDIDDPVVVSYKGKTYGLCCKTCLKKFQKDPEKYISRLSEDGKTLKKKDS